MIIPSQRPLPDNTQHSQQTNIHAPGGIRTHNLSRRAAKDLRLRPRGHWDRLFWYIKPRNIPDDRRPELNGLRSLKSHQRFFVKNSLREIFYFLSSVLSPVLSSDSVVYHHTWFTHTPLTAGEINMYTTSLLMLHV